MHYCEVKYGRSESVSSNICVYRYVALERKCHFIARSEVYRGFYNNSIFITGTEGLYRVKLRGDTDIYRWSYERQEQTIVASFFRLPFEPASLPKLRFHRIYVELLCAADHDRNQIKNEPWFNGILRRRDQDRLAGWLMTLYKCSYIRDYIIIKMFLTNKICRR